MTRSLLRSALVAVATLLALPSAASAQQETELLLEEKAWYAEVGIYSDGDLTCTANTLNRFGEFFSVVWDADGQITLLLGFPEDHTAHRPFTADIEVHADYAPWTFYGAEIRPGNPGAYISFRFSDRNAARDFLIDLGRASVVALKTHDRRDNLATWSLAGSRAVLAAQAQCFLQIQPSH